MYYHFTLWLASYEVFPKGLQNIVLDIDGFKLSEFAYELQMTITSEKVPGIIA